MKKWEYKLHGGTPEKKEELEGQLNKLGGEGWRIINSNFAILPSRGDNTPTVKLSVLLEREKIG